MIPNSTTWRQPLLHSCVNVSRLLSLQMFTELNKCLWSACHIASVPQKVSYYYEHCFSTSCFNLTIYSKYFSFKIYIIIWMDAIYTKIPLLMDNEWCFLLFSGINLAVNTLLLTDVHIWPFFSKHFIDLYVSSYSSYLTSGLSLKLSVL